MQFKQQELALKAEEVALKKVELYGDPGSNTWTTLGNETDDKLMAQERFTDHVNSVNGEINSAKSQIVERYGAAKFNSMVKSWEDAQGVASKATEVPAGAVPLMQSIAKNKNYLNSLKQLESKLKKEAYANVPQENLNLLKSVNGGNNINLVGINNKVRNVSPASVLADVHNGNARLYKDGDGDINLVYKDGYQVTVPYMAFVGDSPKDKALREPLKQLMNLSSNKNNPIAKAEELYKQKLATRTKSFVPEIKAVATNKDGDVPAGVLTRISQLLTATDINKIAANSDFNMGTASNMLLDKNKKDTRVFVYASGDNYEIHLKSEADPRNRQVLRVSKNDIDRYIGPGYTKNLTQESIRLGVGKGDTNINKDPLQSVMQKQFGDFPGIQRLQVTADLNESLSNSELFTPSINIKKKNGRYASFPLSGINKSQFVGYEQGRANLNALTDDVLLKVLKQAYPTFDFNTLDY